LSIILSVPIFRMVLSLVPLKKLEHEFIILKRILTAVALVQE